MPCFIALLQLHIGQSLDLQNHTRYNFLSPVSRFCLYSNISAQSFTLSAFLNSRIRRSSKYSTLALLLPLQALTPPLPVSSTTTPAPAPDHTPLPRPPHPLATSPSPSSASAASH